MLFISLSCTRFCEFSSLFDDKFEVAESLTYFTMGHHDEIDTTTFRVAVWNYVQLIYGMSIALLAKVKNRRHPV